MLWCINICLWLKFKQPSVAARHNRTPTSKGKCLLQHWPTQRLPAIEPLASARPAGAYRRVPGCRPPHACRPAWEMVNLLNVPVRPHLHWWPGMRVPGVRGTRPLAQPQSINPSLSEGPWGCWMVQTLSAQPVSEDELFSWTGTCTQKLPKATPGHGQ